METTDVLIVGAGPSGLVLGSLLGRMGINVRVPVLSFATKLTLKSRSLFSKKIKKFARTLAELL